jgi:hypothetical protein
VREDIIIYTHVLDYNRRLRRAIRDKLNMQEVWLTQEAEERMLVLTLKVSYALAR